MTDVMRDMELDWTDKDAWMIGSAVRDEYEREFGVLPEKQLRTKTCGTGSHCFAVYPEHWRGNIERVVRLHNTFKRAQIDMFEAPSD